MMRPGCLDLYNYVIDNNRLKDTRYPRPRLNIAIETLAIIKEFGNSLNVDRDEEFLLDLKDRIKETYNIAQEIVAKSQSPI